MREILFRGKLESGAWVYGSLVQASDFVGIIERDEERYDYPYMDSTTGCIDGNACIVDPDTVGQYTGLTDKNGTKIFEGDIVKYVDDGYVATGVARFGLYASAGAAFAGHEGFYLDWAGCDWLRKDIGFWATMRPIEVIGSIHDNPELMEVRNG